MTISPSIKEGTSGLKSALLLGATGLVGGHCLQLLLSHTAYHRVTVLARRPAEMVHDRLHWHVVDFEGLEEYAGRFHVDALFSCLGTTKKAAGSAEAFRRVDYGYTLAGAQLAQNMGADTCLLVSSAGAMSSSPFLYMRTKGELETALEALKIPKLHIFRPNMLLGNRAENRPAERLALALMQLVTPAMLGPLRRFRPVQAQAVAQSMVRASVGEEAGRFIHTSLEMAAENG